MINYFELLAVFIGAVSGALAGRQKDMDLFGMYVVGLLTGLGGGTLRNILIGNFPLPIFKDPSYLIVCIPAVIFARYGEPIWSRMRRAISFVDALSLGMFVSLGIRISQQYGYPWWVSIINGMITATFGGVLRDIARVEVPLIFRREIYATACLFGGLVLIGLDNLNVPPNVGVFIITILITTIRILAIRYALNQSSA